MRTANPYPVPPGPPRWLGFRRFLIRSFWVAVCLSIISVLWCLRYVNQRGFSRHWRMALIADLDKRGVHATIGRLTLNPFRGLVAKDVHIVDSHEHGRMLAAINEVVLDINYSNLLHGHDQFINSIDLRDSAVSLPIDPDDRNSERLEISKINARVLLPPHQLYIPQAEAYVLGLHISAAGRFVNPEKYRQSSTENEASDRKRSGLQFREYLRAWERIKATGGKPRLDFRFSGDLADPSHISVQAVLRSGKFTMGNGYQIQSIQIAATYSEELLRLDQCALVDLGGGMDLAGSFRPGTGNLDFRLKSTLDLLALVRAVHNGRLAEDLTCSSPPTLELSGQCTLKAETPGFHGMILGRITLDHFVAKTVAFEGANAEFSWDGSRWFVHDAKVVHSSGELLASAMQTPDEFRFALESHLNPKALVPLMPFPEAEKLAAELDIKTPPDIHLEGHAPTASLDAMEAAGRITLGNTRFRGVGINSLATSLIFKNKTIVFRDFTLHRTEGSGSGTVEYDYGKGEVRLLKVKTTLIPTDVAVWIDSDRQLARDLSPYRFKTRPALLLDGTIQSTHGNEHTRLRIDVDGSGGMDYTFLKKNLSATTISATVWLVGDRLKINNLQGSLFGGTVRGNADISIIRKKGDYTAEIAVDDIDFPILTKLYFDYDTSKGKLQGNYKFSGIGDAARSIVGTGQLTVTDGNVFAIPLFGPFSGILNDVMPGVGYNQARKGTATFDMKDGVIHTSDLAVEGKGFSMLGGGKLFFVDDRIDFTIRINAQGAVGVILSPVSRLLEYVADSSLSKPNWHPKRLPKAMFAPHEKAGVTLPPVQGGGQRQPPAIP